jgi:hypothetical protein
MKGQRKYNRIKNKDALKSTKTLVTMPIFIMMITSIFGVLGVVGLQTYNFISIWNIEHIERGDAGIRGRLGLSGLNNTHSSVEITQLTSIAQTIQREFDSYDFCTNATCSSLNSSFLEIGQVVTESGLAFVNLATQVNSLRFVESITDNSTFCYVDTCNTIAEFVIMYAPLINNGTGDRFDNKTEELRIILSNDTFVKQPISDNNVTNSSISVYKINGYNPNSVVITTAPSVTLTTSTKLATNKGGTNLNSTGSNGFLLTTSGVWSVIELLYYNYINFTGAITDSSFITLPNISGSKVSGGIANGVVINDESGILSASTYLYESLGGFNGNAGVYNGYVLWFNGSVSSYGTILRSTLAPETPNYVVTQNGSGILQSEQYLSSALGGTGADSSSWTGFVYLTNGVWNVTGNLYLTTSDFNLTNALVNADFSTSAAISRTKMASGTLNHVIIHTVGGVLSSEALLALIRGGINADSSAWTGITRVNTGVWSASPLVYADISFTDLIVNADISSSAAITRTKIAADTFFPSNVIINSGGGTITGSSALSLSQGGTGATSVGNGFLRHTTGLLSFTVTGTIAYASLDLSNSIVDADFAAIAGTGLAITRTKTASGTANHVVINNGTGYLTSEAQLTPLRGGTGQDFTGQSGVPVVQSGTWSLLTLVLATSYSPALTFGGANTGIVQLITRGKYTRLGSLCMVEIFLILSSKGSATGSARISLPITAVSSTSSGSSGLLGGTLKYNTPSYYLFALTPEPGASTALFRMSGDNNAITTLDNTYFGASTSVQISFTYFV